jgi:hypothetical protein
VSARRNFHCKAGSIGIALREVNSRKLILRAAKLILEAQRERDRLARLSEEGRKLMDDSRKLGDVPILPLPLIKSVLAIP